MKTRKHTRVLATVNKIRKALGRKPIKSLKMGYLKDELGCPIFNSLGCAILVNENYIEFHDYDSACKVEVALGVKRSDNCVETNKMISNFIIAFDQGKYPELVKK